MSYFSILALLISPLAQLTIGKGLFSQILLLAKKLGIRNTEENAAIKVPLIGYYVLGLLSYLTLVFILCNFGLKLSQSSLLSYLPALLFIRQDAKEILVEIKKEIKLSLNFFFVIWFALHLFLGCSLFSAVDGISTPWVNNFGDLPWHLGIINSFVNGNNFPTENHIFAGERLSYSFYINLWTATIWVFNSDFRFLPAIFTYQWLIIWSAIFFLLKGNKFILLPWVILLGGGTFNFAKSCLSSFFANGTINKSTCSYQLIASGDPWSPFLTTIWVTQRSALFGAMVFITAISLFLSFLKIKDKNLLILSGLILSLSLLVHAHFFLVSVIFCGLILFFDLILYRNKDKLINISFFFLTLLPSLGFLPWVISKRSIISFAGAWMQKEIFIASGLLATLQNSFYFWNKNALPWIISIFFVCILNKAIKELIAIMILFILGNIFQIAVWDWDQIKIFIMIYLISICIWSANDNKKTLLSHFILALPLLIPGLCEFSFNFFPIKKFDIYSASDISMANAIKEETAVNAIVAAAPNHNSPITLSGRKLFFGYVGTLNSQGINYQDREKINLDLNNILNCKQLNLSTVCPNYLLWTGKEQTFWKRQYPDNSKIKNTALPYLFGIN